MTEFGRIQRAPARVWSAASSLPSDSPNALNSGEVALRRAGQALDPNAPGGPALAVGQRLLREAFISGARRACGDVTIDSVEAAGRALAGRADRSGSLAERRRAATVAALHPLSPPVRAALTKAEFQVARLLDETSGAHRVAHAERRALWSLAVLIVAVVSALVLANRGLHPAWEKYRWTASSAFGPYPRSGTLGEHDWTFDLVFHTLEEANPWVVVDLLSTRTVHDVTVINRTDCCRDRGLPLLMELAGEDGKFAQIGARTSPFETWQVTFRPREARYLRLRAKGKTILHFRDVQIR